MSRRRSFLILILLTFVAAALLFRRPIESWVATQSCLLAVRDHYTNIASLEGAPDVDRYMEQGRLQCRSQVAYQRFEVAETAESRQREGDEAIAAYTDLIEQTEHGWIELPRRAAVYAALGHHERALADANRFLTHAPDSYWMLARRGEYYAELGRYEEALADFATVVQIGRQDPEISAAYVEQIEQRMEAIGRRE